LLFVVRCRINFHRLLGFFGMAIKLSVDLEMEIFLPFLLFHLESWIRVGMRFKMKNVMQLGFRVKGSGWSSTF
jgi:hypothetical protein